MLFGSLILQEVTVQGVPKRMSDCPGQVEIWFGRVNL